MTAVYVLTSARHDDDLDLDALLGAPSVHATMESARTAALEDLAAVVEGSFDEYPHPIALEWSVVYGESVRAHDVTTGMYYEVSEREVQS